MPRLSLKGAAELDRAITPLSTLKLGGRVQQSMSQGGVSQQFGGVSAREAFKKSQRERDEERRAALASTPAELQKLKFRQGKELLGQFNQGDITTGAELQGPSESERILIQAQEEAGVRDINRLQDTLSSAGILSSGQLTVGTGEILGRARGEVAKTSAGFAESRLTRRHQKLLAKRQQLTQLISSILV